MDKKTYLHMAVNGSIGCKTYKLASWWFSMFAELVPSNDDRWKNIVGVPYRTPEGMFVTLPKDGETIREKITDAEPNKPLFRLAENITIDKSWLKNVDGKIETSVGRLLLNKFLLEDHLGDRIPYHNGDMASYLEDMFVERAVDDDAGIPHGKISISEMIQIVDRVFFLTQSAPIVNITATRKNVTTAPGMREYKAKLEKERGHLLNDPVEVVKFEEDLEKFDQAYLKDDPTQGVVISGKALKGRRKTGGMMGQDVDFRKGGEATPILTNLEDGISLKPEEFAALNNGLRYGSLARGLLTALSGTVTKDMLRSLGGLSVSDKDCGTTKGVVRVISKDIVKKIVGREVRSNGKWHRITDRKTAEALVGRRVEMRSAMWCKSPKDTICVHCMTEGFRGQPNAIFNLSTEVTANMTGMFMQLMHGNVVTAVEILPVDLIA